MNPEEDEFIEFTEDEGDFMFNKGPEDDDHEEEKTEEDKEEAEESEEASED